MRSLTSSIITTDHQDGGPVFCRAFDTIRKLLVAALLLESPCLAHADTSANLSVNIVPSGGGGGSAPFGLTWDPALSDEFNDSSLDTTKWSVSRAGGCCDGFGGNPANDGVSVSGGNLNLRVSFDGTNYHFGSIVSTSAVTFPPEPSYWEVRMKEAAPSSHLTSINWMLADDIEKIGKKIEIDVQETIALGSNSHAWLWTDNFAPLGGAGGPIASCGGNPINNADGNFHTYGFHRHDGQMDYLFDGCLAQTITDFDAAFRTQRPRLILQLVCESHGCNSSMISGLPQTMLVDYSRVAH